MLQYLTFSPISLRSINCSYNWRLVLYFKSTPANSIDFAECFCCMKDPPALKESLFQSAMPMLGQCWPTVCEAGSTLAHYSFNVYRGRLYHLVGRWWSRHTWKYSIFVPSENDTRLKAHIIFCKNMWKIDMNFESTPMPLIQCRNNVVCPV